MGYHDEWAYEKGYAVVDIETIAHPEAAAYVGGVVLPMPPNLEEIGPAGNLTDPAKKADSQAKRRQAALDAHAEAVTAAQRAHAEKLSRCALDWNLNRIVAIGLQTIGDGGPQVVLCKDENEERVALSTFWYQTVRRRFVGFNARGFDLPTLVQRSRYLGVEMGRDVNLARFGRGDVIDVRELLTFDDARYEAIMTRSLDAFCRRFGIDVPDPFNGAQVAALVESGNWDGVAAHCTADVIKTTKLASRIGVFKGAEIAA
jgi:hypothetical protein